MRTKVLTILAAAVLLAACSSKPETATTTTSTSVSAPAVEAPPPGPVPGSQEDLVANVGDRVFFAFDKSNLTSDATATLDKQAAWLKKWPNNKFTIEGHTDERGTREYNLALGQRRANAVKNYLVAQGIEASRLTTISYGKERPAVVGSNEAAWAQNRRAVSVVMQ